MLLLVFRKVYICNIMSHTNIMQAEENDLVNIYLCKRNLLWWWPNE